MQTYDGRGDAVRVHAKTANSKLAPVDLLENSTDKLRPVPRGPFVVATYLPIEQTCPTTCVFHKRMQNGRRPCYADAGFTGHSIRLMEERAHGMSPLDLADLERRKLANLFHGGPVPQDGARGGRDLRLHVSGDARTIAAAGMMAAIAGDWERRGGGRVWSYTHAWRNVPRSAWGKVSVLASIDRPDQAAAARAQGYEVALVVRQFPKRRRFTIPEHGLEVVPCPAETGKGITCSSCRLCFDDKALAARGTAIGFAAHGMGAGTAKRRLPVLAQTELAL